MACWTVLFLILPGLLATQAPAASSEPVAVSAHLAGSSERTTISFDLTKDVPYRIFMRAEPYAVVVDLPAVQFRLPPGTGEAGTGLVKSFRYGLMEEGKSRIVIDVTGPVLIESDGLTRADGTDIARLRLAIVPTDAETFKASLPKKPVKAKSAEVATATDELAIVPKPKPANAGCNKALRPLVVLDPGHGGPDSGALSPNGAAEKNIVLAIGLKVRERLKALGTYKVLMTRDTDVFIPLKGRVDFAEQRDACLFVSIHADSTQAGRRWQRISGATVYTRSETASDEQARIAALRENTSDAMAGGDMPSEETDQLGDIGLDLVRTETRGLVQVLAKHAVTNLRQTAPMTLQPHRSARFYVLKSPEVPSMLIETGYVNNQVDAAHLIDEEWQGKLADAIVRAIEGYFDERDRDGFAAWMGVGLPEPVE